MPETCGSELARDSGLSANNDVESAAAIASKLAPTLFPVDRNLYIHHQSPVGASLLAIAVAQNASNRQVLSGVFGWEERADESGRFMRKEIQAYVDKYFR